MPLTRPVAQDPYEKLHALPGFQLTSEDVKQGQPLGSAQVAAEGNTSPHLRWSDFPAETKSFVVTCFDPDAPTPSGYWHWGLVDVPADVTELAAGAGKPGAALPGSAFHVRTDGGSFGFEGAAPPAGDHVHRYYFVVHAVGEESLGVDQNASLAVVNFNLAFKAIARAVLMGTFKA